MIRNYFLVAWRNLLRQRFFSAIAILGLTAGISVSFIIGGYVWSERQVNSDIRQLDRQFMINSKWKDESMGWEITSLGPLPRSLFENYPTLVRNYYRYDGITSNVSFGEKTFRESIQVGDSSLLEMFGFRLAEGDPVSALSRPYSVVMSFDAARKYFGKESAIGKVVRIENFSAQKADFVVTGVMSPCQRNTVTQLVGDIPSQLFLSEQNLDFFGRNMSWNNNTIPAYIELQPGVAPDELLLPILELVKKHAPARISDNYSPKLVSLESSYLDANGSTVRRMLFLLTIIAGFLLLMALVNFVNIAVSRASSRMREIGVRKTMGGLRRQLIWQFLTEAWVLVFISALLSLITYIVLRPFAEQVLEKPLPSMVELPVWVWPIFLLFVLLTGLVAGIYPAWVLSSIPASRAIKGKWEAVHERKWLRSGLVGIQFGLAVVALSGAIVISRQVDLFFSKQLGYDTEMILTAQVPRDWTSQGVSKIESIRRQFESMAEVGSATISYEIMDGRNGGYLRLYREGQDSLQAVSSLYLSTDENYASTYRMPLVAGRYLQTESGLVDTLGMVLNETQARSLGWREPSEAVGQAVYVFGDNRRFRITGVARDIHFGSMHKTIESSSFVHLRAFDIYRYISFKLPAGHSGRSIEAIQSRWKVLMPGSAFEYSFMDETLRHLYRTELQLKRASTFASVLSLLIVCLGLAGLVALSVQRRVREMGIRKVLGASALQVMRLFVFEFFPVLIFSSLLIIPIAWWLIRSWLEGFAYRIGLSPVYFVISVVTGILLCVFVIFVQTVRLGWRKPADIIRAAGSE